MPTEMSSTKQSHKSTGNGAAGRAVVLSRTVYGLTAHVFMVACMCAGLALVVCPAAMAASEEAFVSSFGSLSHPTGVAVDQVSGNVYVANGGGPEAINVFGAEGGAPADGAPPVLTGGATPAGSFVFHSEPVGVAVDNSSTLSAGDLYVTDVTGGGEHEVLDRFKLNGATEFEYLSRLTGFGEPVGATVDSEGNVYVADYGHQVVREFNATGEELLQLASPLIGHPQGIAVDIQGDVYVQGYGTGNLVEFKRASPTSAVVSSEVQIALEGVTAVAFDRAGARVLVDFGSYVAEYDTEGHQTGQFGAGTLGMSLGIAVNEMTEKIYVSDAEKAQVDIFEIPPLLPPSVDDESAIGVGSTSAELSAQINPNVRHTTYVFQFGINTLYATGEAPEPSGGDAGAGAVDRTVRVTLSSLLPDATYHYRVKVTNGAGTTYGPDMVFKTFPSGQFVLPDNRAWEMVSPLDKNGGNVAGIRGDNGGGVVQASPEGDAITYVSTASFGDPQGAPSGSQYLSVRKAGGWSTKNITTPLLSDTYFRGGAGTPYKAFSTDLSVGLLPNSESPGRVENPPLPGSHAPPGYSNLYIHETGGNGIQALLTNAPGESAEEFFLTFKLATPDMGHIVMSTPAALAPGSSRNSEGNLYEWSNAGLQAVNVLPGAAEGETAPGRAFLGSGQNEGNILSEDGSRVFWSYEEGADLNLFVRENGTSTVRVDAAEEGAGLNPGEFQLSQFWAASSNGTKAFFTSDAPLTGDANTGPPCGGGCRREGSDLYVFDVDTHHLADLTPDAIDANGADVQGVLGTNRDGTYVYFVATARLAGPNSEGRAPEIGGHNLYVWHAGEGTTFIATLSGDDQSGSDELGTANDWDPSIGRRTARVTPDGLHVAFMSDGSLTGYDNVDANTGVRDEEVYLYDARARELVCASCNPSFGQPVGPSSISRGTIFSNEGRGGEALGQPRVLSSDGGRLFFDSGDALTPQDTNGKKDVYEYENNRIYLLSGGTDREDSSFVDASTNGDDVFFITRQQLVSQDADQLIDLYDVRVNGGFPETAATGGNCQGEGCRLSTTSAPSFGFPATTALGGAGNLLPVAAHVVKGQVKGKAKKHHSKAKHEKKRKSKGRKRRAKGVRRAHRAADHRVDRGG